MTGTGAEKTNENSLLGESTKQRPETQMEICFDQGIQLKVKVGVNLGSFLKGKEAEP